MKILNKRNGIESKNYLYVGRPAPLGNPFTVEEFGREKAIELYRCWLCEKIFLKDLRKIYSEDLDLVCWCAPQPCHAEYIKEVVEFKRKYKRLAYAGIGSRETPEDTLERMRLAAMRLHYLGYTLRSGGAKGADTAFEEGHDLVEGHSNKEIFYANDANKQALEIVKEIHPNWAACSDYAKKLHARNAFQILGRDLNSPVDFVICWTKNGEKVGGTRTAIVLAEKNNIPVYNLYNSKFPL